MPVNPPKKRVISPEGRERLREGARRRWRLYKQRKAAASAPATPEFRKALPMRADARTVTLQQFLDAVEAVGLRLLLVPNKAKP